MTLDLTVTSHLAETPLWAIQIIFAVPIPTPVTNPLLLTMATPSLEVVQITVLFVALLGIIVFCN